MNAALLLCKIHKQVLKSIELLVSRYFLDEGDQTSNSATSRRVDDEKDRLSPSRAAVALGKKRRLYALEESSLPTWRHQGTNYAGQDSKRHRHQNVNRKQDSESNYLFDNFLESFFKP